MLLDFDGKNLYFYIHFVDFNSTCGKYALDAMGFGTLLPFFCPGFFQMKKE